MLNAWWVIGAALLFAAWLRWQFYILFADGLIIAVVLFLIYLVVAAAVNG
ncbi:hypothetical protein K378_01418 [Streptomyces sp. Amel2xB2]|nr:hypothetical protein [Streptomyces sp. Amel2xB2]RAJ70253.1 hypothetical protein K378_01418 [Streptomyces sp. Amel2xB2]